MQNTDNMIACEIVDNSNLHSVLMGIQTGIITLGKNMAVFFFFPQVKHNIN